MRECCLWLYQDGEKGDKTPEKQSDSFERGQTCVKGSVCSLSKLFISGRSYFNNSTRISILSFSSKRWSAKAKITHTVV